MPLVAAVYDMIVENFLQQKTVAKKKKGETAKTATP
jgi:hypothetical protein